MQIKLARHFFVFFLAALLTACSGSGPEKVAEKYMSSMISADIDTFLATVYLSEEEKAQFSMMRDKLEEMFKMAQHQANAAGGIKSIKATKTEYSTDKENATVTLRISFKNGTSEEDRVRLINTKGGWKVRL